MGHNSVKKEINSKNVVFHIISNVISWSIFAILAIIALFLVYYVIAAQLYANKGEKYKPAFALYTIISGSMEPTIKVYDVVFDVKVDDPSKLKEGDVITVQDLLYGLLLESGNDAAIALAEYCSGSVEEFAKLMNSTAKSFGATNSSFVNPSGLPDENHYTTIYDMYLIFSNAISLESFVAIISSQTHDAAYTNAQGAAVSKTFKNTCGYLTGAYTAPENVTVTGGKTGTTGEAGHCLVLLSQNAKNERIISIVYKADGKKDLYSFMNEILSGFAN